MHFYTSQFFIHFYFKYMRRRKSTESSTCTRPNTQPILNSLDLRTFRWQSKELVLSCRECTRPSFTNHSVPTLIASIPSKCGQHQHKIVLATQNWPHWIISSHDDAPNCVSPARQQYIAAFLFTIPPPLSFFCGESLSKLQAVP